MKTDSRLRFQHPDVSAHVHGRLAVIDLGSSTVRLVVYEDPRSYPYMVLNQKVWCALGEGKGKGVFRLAKDKMQRVMAILRWFTWVAREAGAVQVIVFATSAVREAENGKEFAERIHKELGLRVNILTGEDEARLSAVGARLSIPDAQGLVIDLGGGSLEVYSTESGQLVSLPLGVLTLKALAGNCPKKAVEILKEALANVPWLREQAGGSLIAIGSGMRSIARLHMADTRYPMPILHDYRLCRADGEQFCRRLIDGDVSRRLHDMSLAYADVLPYRAAALAAFLESGLCEEVRFATFGLREGVLLTQIGEAPVVKDPLVAFAADHAERSGRGLVYADGLAEWVKRILPDVSWRYLRTCAMFSEIAWREQPIYRAMTAYNQVLGGSYVGAGHNLRMRVALAAFFRHEDKLLPGMKKQLRGIVSPEEIAECQVIGALFNLASLLDPGAKSELDRFRMERHDNGVWYLQAPREFKLMQSEEVAERLKIVRRRLKKLEQISG